MSEKKQETKDSQEENDILRTLENALREILALILEYLSQLITSSEEKQDIENLIFDYNSLDQLIKIIYSTFAQDGDQQMPLSVEYLALEKMLQKYESECREHIKNEQQLQIYAETLENKLEQIERNAHPENEFIEPKNGSSKEVQKENQQLQLKIMSLSNEKIKLQNEINELKNAKNKQDQAMNELQKKITKQEQINQTKPKFSNPIEQYYQSNFKNIHLAKKNYGINSGKMQQTSKIYNFDKQKNDTIFKHVTKQFTQLDKLQSYSILNKTTTTKLKRNQSESQLQQYINYNPKILNQKSQTLLAGSKHSIPVHLNSQYLLAKSKRNKSSQAQQNSLSRDKYIVPAQKESKSTKKYKMNKTQGMNFSALSKQNIALQQL